jgi:hypothetical protein
MNHGGFAHSAGVERHFESDLHTGFTHGMVGSARDERGFQLQAFPTSAQAGKEPTRIAMERPKHPQLLQHG